MIVSDKVYNVLKPTTTIFLPGISTLYFTLAQIWGLPAAEQVVGTIAAVNVFLGLLVGLSTKAYNNETFDGDLVLHETEDGRAVLGAAVKGDPMDLMNKSEVRLKVNPDSTPKF